MDQEEEGVKSIVTVDCELRLQQMMTRFTDGRVLNFEVRERAMSRMAQSLACGLHGSSHATPTVLSPQRRSGQCEQGLVPRLPPHSRRTVRRRR